MSGQRTGWLLKPGPWAWRGLAAVLSVVLCVLLVWPIAAILQSGFQEADGGFSLAALHMVWSDASLVRGLSRSLAVCGGATCVATLLAMPLAWLYASFDFAAKSALFRLLLLPLVVPSFVGAIGLRLLLSRFGPLTQLGFSERPLGVDWIGQYPLLGVVVVQGLSLYPLVLLNLQAAFQKLDLRQLQAAKNLGAGRLTTFSRVVVPQLRPGLLAGVSLVAIWSFTDLGTPLVFHVYDLSAVQVYVYLAEPENPLPYALVFVMLGCSSLLYLLGHWGLGKSVIATSKLVSAVPPTQLRGYRATLAILPTGLVVLLASLPIVAVIGGSFSEVGSWYRSLFPTHGTLQHYATMLSDEMVAAEWSHGGLRLGALGNSIAYALGASFLATVLALGVSLVAERSSLRGRRLLDALAMLPMAVPGLVMAFGYLAVSVRLTQAFGEGAAAWMDVREAPAVFLVLAYATRRMPFAVRSVSAGLAMVPRQLEDAALNLGASWLRVLMGISLPLISSSVWAGATVAFLLSILEVSDSLVLAQSEAYYPLTRAIWELSQRLGDGLHVACALGVWAMATLACVASLAPVSMASLFRVNSASVQGVRRDEPKK